MQSSLEVRAMSAADVDRAVEWAAREGWNPGHEDARCFATVDPQGFMSGWLDGQMVASISVVNYGAGFSFLGFYIVDPPYRGKGHGYALWQRAVEHAGDRIIGLDGVPAEQENYRRSGFELAYRNIRYGGPAPDVQSMQTRSGADAFDIVPITDLSPQLTAFDGRLFPAPRETFLQAWLSAPGHVARAVLAGNELKAYGVIRPCRNGYKVGPLFADARATAEALLADLLAGADITPGSAEIFLDTPEPNAGAIALAEAIGLAPVFETARMYRGPAPAIELNEVFGVTTFELG